MLSFENIPQDYNSADKDFTLDHYRELLRLAKSKYDIASYDDPSFSNNSLLWRHDVDLSLERSLILAKIENEEGFKATYFVNPHSEFYNLSEKSQVDIVNKILNYGHAIGLHFDSTFYENKTSDLDNLLLQESSYLENLFGIAPIAFSFHNPNEIDLTKDADQYGGMINCYSSFFKNAGYCSDANGYWRFERLYDFLDRNHNTCIQVCTHAGWWHEISLPPRIRVMRAAYDRSNKTMEFYNKEKSDNGRENPTGNFELDKLLESLMPEKRNLFNYLLCYEYYHILIIELWRLHTLQVKEICALLTEQLMSITDNKTESFIDEESFIAPIFKLVQNIYEEDWEKITGTKKYQYEALNKMILDFDLYNKFQKNDIKNHCYEICQIVNKTSIWTASKNFK